MKIIDLYNKIANGEEVPEKIRYCSDLYEIDYRYMDYKNKYINDTYLLRDVISSSEELCNKIEVVEEVIEYTPKEDILNYKDLLQQEINNENEILLSRLESDTKLDIIKNYITSEEAIDNFKTIESRNEWLEVHDKILDIIDNYKLQKESGEIIEDTPKEDKKIEKINMNKLGTITDIKNKINEIIDKINGE